MSASVVDGEFGGPSSHSSPDGPRAVSAREVVEATTESSTVVGLITKTIPSTALGADYPSCLHAGSRCTRPSSVKKSLIESERFRKNGGSLISLLPPRDRRPFRLTDSLPSRGPRLRTSDSYLGTGRDCRVPSVKDPCRLRSQTRLLRVRTRPPLPQTPLRLGRRETPPQRRTLRFTDT